MLLKALNYHQRLHLHDWLVIKATEVKSKFLLCLLVASLSSSTLSFNFSKTPFEIKHPLKTVKLIRQAKATAQIA
jgi:hypothetical protein